MARAMKRVQGNSYIVGSSAKAQYLASGAVEDWLFGINATQLAFTIELPDQGQSGFLLPPQKILPVSKELKVGIFCALEYIGKFGECHRNPPIKDLE